MWSWNKNQVSTYDPSKLPIYSILRQEDDLVSKCGHNCNKKVSFDDFVHFIDEQNIVTFEEFDSDITLLLSTLKFPQKSNRSTENGITFPHPMKMPCAFLVTIGITVLLMSSITLIFFWTRAIHGTWFRQLLCHWITLMIDTLCPISTLNQQLTNLELTHIRCSLHCEGWTVKGRGCASVLHSFNEITYQTDEWMKQLLRLKSWVISGNPERRMEVRRLWWTVTVLKCSHLFHLFDFYCLLVQHLLFFFQKFTCFVPFDDFEWEIKLHR